MKKYTALALCLAVLLCAGCGHTAAPSAVSSTVTSPSSSSSVSEEAVSNPAESSAVSPESEADSSAEQADPPSESGGSSEEDPESNIGAEDYCLAHKYLYHSYDAEMLNYVGYEAFAAWGKSVVAATPPSSDAFVETANIVSFVQHFNIPKETFIELVRGSCSQEFLDEYDGSLVYSLEQIDAIYSGDQRLINEAFCGPLAFVNEADGELYSIYWLADHTAEDCVKANLPMDKVAEILTVAREEYASSAYTVQLAEKVEATYTEALALQQELAAASGAAE